MGHKLHFTTGINQDASHYYGELEIFLKTICGHLSRYSFAPINFERRDFNGRLKNYLFKRLVWPRKSVDCNLVDANYKSSCWHIDTVVCLISELSRYLHTSNKPVNRQPVVLCMLCKVSWRCFSVCACNFFYFWLWQFLNRSHSWAAFNIQSRLLWNTFGIFHYSPGRNIWIIRIYG